MPITEPIDEDELEADLAALEQENLDEKMLKTGTVPVADSLNRLPKAANGERQYRPLPGVRRGKSLSLTKPQSRANRKRRRRRKTRRRSCGNCRPRWPCESIPGRRKRNGGPPSVRLSSRLQPAIPSRIKPP